MISGAAIPGNRYFDPPEKPATSCGNTGPQITSAVFFLNFLFLGGAEPPCMKACDSNGDGNGDLSDGVYVLDPVNGRRYLPSGVEPVS